MRCHVSLQLRAKYIVQLDVLGYVIVAKIKFLAQVAIADGFVYD